MSVLNLIILIFLILSTILIYSGKIISAFRDLKYLITAKSNKIQKEINLLQLEHFINPRFNFSFDAPKIWDRKDPINSDGHIILNPRDENIAIYAWGSYFTKNFLGNDTDSFSKDKSIKIIENTYSGLSAYEYINKNDDFMVVKEYIEGERKIIEFKKNKKNLRAILFTTEYDDRSITIQCEAPKNLYPLYENLFYNIGKSLKILK